MLVTSVEFLGLPLADDVPVVCAPLCLEDVIYRSGCLCSGALLHLLCVKLQLLTIPLRFNRAATSVCTFFIAPKPQLAPVSAARFFLCLSKNPALRLIRSLRTLYNYRPEP